MFYYFSPNLTIGETITVEFETLTLGAVAGLARPHTLGLDVGQRPGLLLGQAWVNQLGLELRLGLLRLF